MSVIKWLKDKLFPVTATDPQTGYDQWADNYDDQPGNLVLDVDKDIFSALLLQLNLQGKTIVDIGCGTGRHWAAFYAAHPARVIGYDVSEKMLDKLKEKFTDAEVYTIHDNKLPQLKNRECDILISTLALAHIPDMAIAFTEWNRVLKPGADIILTDYHPEALQKGTRRTFLHEGRLIALRNYIYPLEKIRRLAGQLQWKELRFTERVIDETVKHYYEQQHSRSLYERFRGTPIVYGIHLKKSDDPA